jgi:cytochrome oxidase Cu insertion factor (SCO1/SenC/PrrC family)
MTPVNINTRTGTNAGIGPIFHQRTGPTKASHRSKGQGWRRFVSAFAQVFTLVSVLAFTGVGADAVPTGLAPQTQFTLTDHSGESVTRDSFNGQLALVYFGYTHCPDICPPGLSTISPALNELGLQANDVRTFFVTIDPERDTLARLAQYVPAFHAGLIGVTGQIEQIRILAKDLGARFVVGKLKDRVYVDHTDAMYLLTPSGKLTAQFDGKVSAAQLVAAVLAGLAQ